MSASTWSAVTWDVARAGGLMAYVLLTLSVALGLALSARWQRPRWPLYWLPRASGQRYTGTVARMREVANTAESAYLTLSSTIPLHDARDAGFPSIQACPLH